MELLIFIAVGVFTGLSAGMLGVGGGIVSVPAMIILLPYFNVPPDLIMHMAIATSLALILPTSIISAYQHAKKNGIVWPLVNKMTPGLIAGSFMGAYFVVKTESVLLENIFSSLLILIALYLLFDKPKTISPIKEASYLRSKKYSMHYFTGLVIGVVSAVMGVGGGTMMVPYLLWQKVPMKKAVGSAAFCGLPIAAAGSAMFFIMQLMNNDEVLGKESGLIYWPAFIGILMGVIVFTPIGVKIAHRMNVRILKRIFITMLLTVAIKLLVF